MPSFFFLSPHPPKPLILFHLILVPGTLELTNLAYDPDALDLEEEEEAGVDESQRTPKTSVSSVTTPPSTTKRIPFFKKVMVALFTCTCLLCPDKMPACVYRLFLSRSSPCATRIEVTKACREAYLVTDHPLAILSVSYRNEYSDGLQTVSGILNAQSLGQQKKAEVLFITFVTCEYISYKNGMFQ